MLPYLKGTFSSFCFHFFHYSYSSQVFFFDVSGTGLALLMAKYFSISCNYFDRYSLQQKNFYLESFPLWIMTFQYYSANMPSFNTSLGLLCFSVLAGAACTTGNVNEIQWVAFPWSSSSFSLRTSFLIFMLIAAFCFLIIISSSFITVIRMWCRKLSFK